MEEQNKILHAELCGLKDVMDERLRSVSESLNRIELQTTKTNGRVRSLEVWKGFMMGGMAILSALVIPMVIMVFGQFVK